MLTAEGVAEAVAEADETLEVNEAVEVVVELCKIEEEVAVTEGEVAATEEEDAVIVEEGPADEVVDAEKVMKSTVNQRNCCLFCFASKEMLVHAKYGKMPLLILQTGPPLYPNSHKLQAGNPEAHEQWPVPLMPEEHMAEGVLQLQVLKQFAP